MLPSRSSAHPARAQASGPRQRPLAGPACLAGPPPRPIRASTRYGGVGSTLAAGPPLRVIVARGPTPPGAIPSGRRPRRKSDVRPPPRPRWRRRVPSQGQASQKSTVNIRLYINLEHICSPGSSDAFLWRTVLGRRGSSVTRPRSGLEARPIARFSVKNGPHTMHTRGFDFECGRDEKRGGYYITG